MEQPVHSTPAGEPRETRALSALKRLARPQPKAFDAPAPPAQELPLGSATGFVSTLAKGLPEDSRAGEAAADDSRAGEPHKDDSSVGTLLTKDGSLAGAAAASALPRPAGELIQMAREITVQRPASPLSNGINPGTSRWARGGSFAILMAMLGIALLGIGGWAVGAVIYMHQVAPLSPRDIHYPLLVWNGDLQAAGAYDRTSVFMAWGMLACVPVGLILLAGALSLRRRAIRSK